MDLTWAEGDLLWHGTPTVVLVDSLVRRPIDVGVEVGAKLQAKTLEKETGACL